MVPTLLLPPRHKSVTSAYDMGFNGKKKKKKKTNTKLKITDTKTVKTENWKGKLELIGK